MDAFVRGNAKLTIRFRMARQRALDDEQRVEQRHGLQWCCD